MRVWTVGHSTRSVEEFIRLLAVNGIERVVDIRRYPGSRRWPWFNQGELRERLVGAGIAYEWLEALGGRRHGEGAKGASVNRGLRVSGFRNYADYMATKAFREGIGRLLAWAQEKRTAVMCAERVYWKCHRRLVSDYLTAQGVEVLHILETGRVEGHRMTPGAVVEVGGVVYPGEEERGLFDGTEDDSG